MDAMSSPRPELSDAEVKRLTGVGPKASLVAIGDDFYQRDGSAWAKLESAAQASGLRGAPPPGGGGQGDDVSAAREAR